MKIPLKVNIVVFYKVLLTLMNKFPPVRGLRPKEIDILAEIMYQNYENRNIKDFDKRQIFIFSTKNRQAIVQNLGITAGTFNNYLKLLKKKKVITSDNKLLPFLNIIPEKEYELNFKFTINE